jgi:uncharacterized protein
VKPVLLDANVLISLLDADHLQHDAAHEWMRSDGSKGFATCPLTENACLRIMSQQSYPGALPLQQVRAALQSLRGHPAWRFWPDSISLCGDDVLSEKSPLVSTAVTDVYLLALAVSKKSALITFDRRIAWQCVIGASEKSLQVLG